MQNGKYGTQLHSDITELFIRLFADDVVLLSYTPIGLQQQLNSHQFSPLPIGRYLRMTGREIFEAVYSTITVYFPHCTN